MATADECKVALASLLGRISELSPEDRAAYVVERSLSCRVPDLGASFMTQLGPDGVGPIEQGVDGESAQVRFTINSDDLLTVAERPEAFAKLWLTGRVKVHGSIFDLLRLRKFL